MALTEFEWDDVDSYDYYECVHFFCKVPGCKWSDDIDWGSMDMSPPATYRRHYEEKHGQGQQVQAT